jgi:hypothetical protein
MKLFKTMLLRELDNVKKSSLLITIKKDFNEISHFYFQLLKTDVPLPSCLTNKII